MLVAYPEVLGFVLEDRVAIADGRLDGAFDSIVGESRRLLGQVSFHRLDLLEELLPVFHRFLRLAFIAARGLADEDCRCFVELTAEVL